MASNKLTELVISFSKRNARMRGPSSSHAWNDMGEELSRDLSSIHAQWNNSLFPLLAALPDGDDYPTIDPYVDGLDGRTLFVNSIATAVNAGAYYNGGQSRPNTVYEQYQALYSYIDTKVDTVQEQVDAGALAAEDIPIEDSGDVFSSTNVENALQEIMSLVVTTGSDHGSLTGLSDDDHSIYLPRSGSRAMTGTLDMGSNSIGSVVAISGVSTSTITGFTSIAATTSMILGSGNYITTSAATTTLSSGVATTILSGTAANSGGNRCEGGQFIISISVIAAGGFQSFTQTVNYAVVASGTTPVVVLTPVTAADAKSATSGTLTTTYSSTSGSSAYEIKVAATTSLASPTMVARIVHTLMTHSG